MLIATLFKFMTCLLEVSLHICFLNGLIRPRGRDYFTPSAHAISAPPINCLTVGYLGDPRLNSLPIIFSVCIFGNNGVNSLVGAVLQKRLIPK